jgi:hypothetical protein
MDLKNKITRDDVLTVLHIRGDITTSELIRYLQEDKSDFPSFKEFKKIVKDLNKKNPYRVPSEILPEGDPFPETEDFPVLPKVEIYPGRRCGNTTRQIDDAIQKLFITGKVTWHDHAEEKENMARDHGFTRLLRRLREEHDLKPGDGVLYRSEFYTLELQKKL